VDIEQKMAAFGFNITRMHSLHLDPDKKKKNGKQYNPKQRTTIFHDAYFKTEPLETE